MLEHTLPHIQSYYHAIFGSLWLRGRGGGFQDKKLWKHNFKIIIDPKDPPNGPIFCGVLTPHTIRRQPYGHAHFFHKNTNTTKKAPYSWFMMLSWQISSPCAQGDFEFQSWPKITKLWPKNVCPYMGIMVNFCVCLITWPNINIFG